MNQREAELKATDLSALEGITAYVVRILPAHVDPIRPNDNGWDVEVTVTEEK